MKDPVKILIAEDSPTQATRLRYMLEDQGYKVITTRNGREALKTLATDHPTVVITDINMPEMDGYELCRRIRSAPEFSHVPVILLTSLSDPEDVFRGLECGADNFVTKPYEETHLLARIDYLLANQHMREQEKARVSIEVMFGGQTTSSPRTARRYSTCCSPLMRPRSRKIATWPRRATISPGSTNNSKTRYRNAPLRWPRKSRNGAGPRSRSAS